MPTLDPETFWQDSCALYRNPVLSARLLDWQNRLGKNVNLCLLLIDLDGKGLALGCDDLALLENTIHDFDARILAPLRKVRAELKRQSATLADYTAIREQALGLELMLEKHQQGLLVAACNTLNPTPAARPENLKSYLPESEWPLIADLDQLN